MVMTMMATSAQIDLNPTSILCYILQHEALLELERLKISQDKAHRKQKDKSKNPQPWRGSDPVPKDTWRYNVLENDDVVADVTKM